jgi:hypothetical protein
VNPLWLRGINESAGWHEFTEGWAHGISPIDVVGHDVGTGSATLLSGLTT